MHLTALVDQPDHVCCRYRLAAFRPVLERAGHTLELRPCPRQWWQWFRLPAELRGSDLVILQRRLPQRWQIFLLRSGARRLLFDFDDAVYLRDSYSRRGLHSRGRLRRFAALCSAADGIIAGNSFLAMAAARWVKRERVHVVPTCVDASLYAPASVERRSEDAVHLVWIGSSSTLQGMERVRPMLEELGRRQANLRLKLICDRFFPLQHLPVVPCPWKEATEAAELAAADIGLSWIPDDDWSRGKCGLKVLQYMAAGLPVVANAVGVHGDIVKHGETGLLADSPEQWRDAVLMLARDEALRRRMGEAGRRLVEARYSVQVGAAAWLSLLDSGNCRMEAA